MNAVRKSVVAGAFYPSNRNELFTLINDCFSGISSTTKNDCRGFIIPHAGYIYSGKTAAYSYSIIKELNPENIIIIGPSHRVSFNGFSIDTMNQYETPLGNLEQNTELCNILIKEPDTFCTIEDAHNKEHSIDVHMPFIKHICPKAKVTCIIAGNISQEHLDKSSYLLYEYIKNNPNTIIIASTDLSHFHSDNKAKEMDSIAIDSILKMDGQKLLDAYREGKTELCGFIPVMTLMRIMYSLNYTMPVFLKYSHSGDITGDNISVVGYVSIAFEKESTELDINTELKTYLLNLARHTIATRLGLTMPEPASSENNLLSKKRGAFVTLHKNGQLRGCIGYIKAIKPLGDTIKEMAISAAFRDMRFSPLQKEEFNEIDIEISVLSPIYKVNNINDIEIGKHGVIISKGSNSGLLLPQVATEWNWDLETFVSQTCVKAGLPPDEWKRGVEISIFSAEVFGEKEIGLI